MTRRFSLLALASVVVLLAMAPMAHAIPALQIWSPDAVYDGSSDSWVISDDTYELWVIGAVGDVGTIYDVTLAASYYGTAGTIAINPNLALDPNYASKPGYSNGVVNHEEFKNADGHIFYQIGDFTQTTSQLQDYIGNAQGQLVVDPNSTHYGEIKKFMIHVTGYDAVHFDAFDHYFTDSGRGANYTLRPVNAPFSHDATSGGTSDLPEPGMLALMGSGLLGLAAVSRRRR